MKLDNNHPLDLQMLNRISYSLGCSPAPFFCARTHIFFYILFYIRAWHSLKAFLFFVFQNEQALSGAVDASSQASIKEADKPCKVILGRVSRGSACIKSGVFVLVLAAAIGFAASPNMESWDLKKLHSMISSSLQS